MLLHTDGSEGDMPESGMVKLFCSCNYVGGEEEIAIECRTFRVARMSGEVAACRGRMGDERELI